MYKRNESFRYQFAPPILGEFKLTMIGDRPINSSSGIIHIIDISQGGIKCKIPFDIDVKQSVKLRLSFKINDNVLKLTGMFIWKQKKINQYYYGVKLDTNDTLYTILKEELKRYEQSKRTSRDNE
ncbi:PilZ domain-containing protein [Bacillus sp. Marseille-P3661]|uniref:PilZ domain-containing protein n=1 Tax=Bacillus sp. Marseille-P3661 TaxID=1936234 RepID=UPI000C85B6C0|nr:PilZ domain-containing protein [Bacillus sp. Marseille-P3661]